jgi:pimeloyl-ACP methyl ester carboxylesterase
MRIARFFARQDRMLRAARRRLPLVVRTARSRRLAFRDVMRRGELVAPADALALANSSLRCTVVRQVLDGLRRDGGRDVMPHRLGEIDVPVLVAWARHDRILPLATCSARFRDEIPGAEFRVLEGVGHLPMWDDSRLVAGTIADWVGRHATVAAEA